MFASSVQLVLTVWYRKSFAVCQFARAYGSYDSITMRCAGSAIRAAAPGALLEVES